MNSSQAPGDQFVQHWTKRFLLLEEDLVLMTSIFPDIEDSRPDFDLGRMCEAILEEPVELPSVEEALEIYKAAGEFAAARRLLTLKAGSDVALQREMDRLHEATLSQLDNTINAVAAQVRELGKLLVVDSESTEMKEAVEQCRSWLRRGRTGMVRKTLSGIEQRVDKHVKVTEDRLNLRIRELKERTSSLPYEQRLQVDGLLAVSGDRLRQRELRLAENACERAAIVLEGGDLDTSGTPELRAMRLIEAPPLNASQLLSVLENDALESHPQVATWDEFFQTWEIGQLRSSSGRPVRDALSAFMAAREETSMKLGADNPWPRFLRRFMECLVNAPTLGGFTQLPTKMGAFTSMAGRLSAPGSFLDAKPDLWKSEALLVIAKQPRQPSGLAQELARRNVLLKGRLILVFTDENVGKQHSDDLRAAFKAHDTLAVLVDQVAIVRILCASSAHDRTDRFVSTLARQLPEATINPFRSDNAVSESMFFGREKEIRQLLDSQESFAVFGGRKLGKTSLLKKIERVAEHEDIKCITIWLDIKNLTSDEDVQRAILGELKNPRDGRKAWKGKFSALEPDSPGTFVDQIKSLKATFPDYRFLFLLDEADAFMNRLAKDTDNFGWALRSLCSADPRVRFIFAGFQDVYRACREALAGPWYNFIRLLVLHVLDDSAAEQLITRSLGLLGLYFKTPELVQRMLDYTSCHASLLQEFCHRLFELVSADVEPGLFGYISSEHVEAVFSDPEFKAHIDSIIHVNVYGDDRTKRSLKLMLYTWVYRLVSPVRADDTQEMISARGLYEFLEEEFGHDQIAGAISFDQVDSYLNDLLALGVLGRSRDGQKYYLRNRHFARMLQVKNGTQRLRSEIVRLLDQIGTDTGVRARRLWVKSNDGTLREFSPFTWSDEQLWRNTNSSTIMIFSSPGMGKSWALRWMESQITDADARQARKGSRVLTLDLVEAKKSTDGLAMLAERVGATSSSLSAICAQLQALATGCGPDTPFYLLVDNADCLADLDLLIGQGTQDGLFQTIHSHATVEGACFKVVLATSSKLARIWVDWADELRGMAVGISLRRLTMAEVADWADGNRLMGVIAEELYKLTGGHPHLLRSFYQMLNSGGKERTVLQRDLNQFRSALESKGPIRQDAIDRLVAPADQRSTLVLSSLREVFTTLEMDTNVVDQTVIDVARDQKRPTLLTPTFDWESEVKVLLLLDELEPGPKGNERIMGKLRPLYPYEKGISI